MKLFSKVFNYVVYATTKFKIDESHGLTHSLDVLKYSNLIYKLEVIQQPILKDQENIIYIASALHDMCDKKYMNENEGLKSIQDFLQDKIKPEETDAILKIITTMSYSKVKKNGFPDLGSYQWAYNIVREADLLAGYNFERAMVYHMYIKNENLENAYIDAKEMFDKRVFNHNKDNLFLTKYGKRKSIRLHRKAIPDIDQWSKICLNIS
jgi:HD superfamily phosphodiesterase